MLRRARSLPVVLVLSLLVLVACGGDDPTVDGGGNGGGTIDIQGVTANDHGSADVAGETEVAVELGDNYFAPTILSGEAGQTLTVELSNEGAAPHTFTIDEQDVDVELQPGDTATAEVALPESGAVVFHCHFHEAQGMLGALSVGGDLAPAPGAEGGAHHDETTGGVDGEQPADEDDGPGKY